MGGTGSQSSSHSLLSNRRNKASSAVEVGRTTPSTCSTLATDKLLGFTSGSCATKDEGASVLEAPSASLAASRAAS
eukprot:CAMPEP_0118995606 /NCGR_PEP_ID=MMETSP1173-20130426/58755_1 /TAXON_ID=1034831 /ORGANISM="Rhizochromulina marina cf, Strain CCMP1243" /LENGTH=75 /DNA_ID=CAMNT_0006946951 /DNA_START=87 /DNA_END=314 /DNA_ORIENTATION=-